MSINTSDLFLQDAVVHNDDDVDENDYNDEDEDEPKARAKPMMETNKKGKEVIFVCGEETKDLILPCDDDHGVYTFECTCIEVKDCTDRTCHNLTRTCHNLTRTCHNLTRTFHNLTRR